MRTKTIYIVVPSGTTIPPRAMPRGIVTPSRALKIVEFHEDALIGINAKNILSDMPDKDEEFIPMSLRSCDLDKITTAFSRAKDLAGDAQTVADLLIEFALMKGEQKEGEKNEAK